MPKRPAATSSCAVTGACGVVCTVAVKCEWYRSGSPEGEANKVESQYHGLLFPRLTILAPSLSRTGIDYQMAAKAQAFAHVVALGAQRFKSRTSRSLLCGLRIGP